MKLGLAFWILAIGFLFSVNDHFREQKKPPTVTIFRDEARQTTCYVTRHAIFCVPDGRLPL